MCICKLENKLANVIEINLRECVSCKTIVSELLSARRYRLYSFIVGIKNKTQQTKINHFYCILVVIFQTDDNVGNNNC